MVTLLWVLVFIVSLSNSSCAQNTRKIKIIPKFLNLPNEYRGNIINKPQDLEKVVTDGIVSKIDSKFVLNVWDLSEEEIIGFFLSLPVPNDPKQFDADFFLWGIFDGREGLLNLDLTAVKTARSISASIDLTRPLKKGIADEIIDTILLMFSDDDKVNEIATIKAGEIIDAYNSVVQYKLQTVEGVDLEINVNYDGLQEYVYGISFKQVNKEPSFSPRLTLTCDDGHLIYINFGPDGEVNPNNDILINFNPNNNIDATKEFTVKSQEGHEIIFQFKWTGGIISDVQIHPMINPYTPQTYKINSIH
jgi:hypothetical protein